MSRLSRWCRTWGATDLDLRRTMPGDKQVALPSYEATLGVTINTAPATIWPWLLQMGYRRGGLYSYDWLDRLFGYLDAPSANAFCPSGSYLRTAMTFLSHAAKVPDKRRSSRGSMLGCDDADRSAL